jgi:hypothetical protein
MLRPLLRVARPTDWTGALARTALGVLLVLLMLAVVLAKIPGDLAADASAARVLIRIAGALVVLWLMAWLRALVYSRLPMAASLWGNRLTVAGREGKETIELGRIEQVHVELRPPPVHQVFVIELDDQTLRDVCPVDWPGAGRLYARLAQKIDARQAAARTP